MTSSKVPEESGQCLQGPTPKEGKISTTPTSGGGGATSLGGSGDQVTSTIGGLY
jgi:hypothetical protein